MAGQPPLPNLRGAVDLSTLLNRRAANAQGPASPAAPAGSSMGVPASDGGSRETSAPAAPSAPGAAAEIPVPNLILNATDDTFSAVLDLSASVPVIVDIWAEWCDPCKQLSPVLDKLTLEFAGRFVLVKVDADKNPQLVQAFQAQSIPTVAAVIGGRPVQLFQGAVPEAQVREVLTQLLTLAEQNGVTGLAVPAEGAPPAATPEPAPLPPLHQEAFDAAEKGDYPTAIAAWKKALAQNPNDEDARAGLAQISLLHRLEGKTMTDVREAAAANPTGVEQQMAVADLDISGGHFEDGFLRLLELFPKLDADGKNAVRERLLDLFEVVGKDDPTVQVARRQLTNLLY